MVDRTPVSIVTGFLGSGKTTLIASLLRQPDMAGTAVVVNEFGEVGIDDAIIAEVVGREEVLLLSNGCLCCTAGDDLTETLLDLTTGRKGRSAPRRILIETTGLADPVPMLHRLMADPRLRDAIRLDAIVATVDAINGAANLDSQPVAARQSAVADRRVITKSDLVGASQVMELTNRLRGLNPGADIRIVVHGQIAADQLFGASLYDPKQGKADVDRWLGLEGHRTAGHDHTSQDEEPAHGQSVRTWLIEEARPVDWTALSDRLRDIVDRHGDVLLRLKGVVWTTDDPRPLVIHGVQRLYHRPVRIEQWPGRPRTSIVLIGSEGALAARRLIAEALADAASAKRGSPLPESALAMAETSKFGGIDR